MSIETGKAKVQEYDYSFENDSLNEKLNTHDYIQKDVEEYENGIDENDNGIDENDGTEMEIDKIIEEYDNCCDSESENENYLVDQHESYLDEEKAEIQARINDEKEDELENIRCIEADNQRIKQRAKYHINTEE
jgi:hypothetical protein